jgi:hypothetical protein
MKCRFPISGETNLAQDVPMTSFAGFVKIFWNLEPHSAIRLKSSGRESIPFKRSFLDGERPIKPVRIARDLIKISITLTPLGQLAEHDPHRRHRFRRSYTPFGSLNISCKSPSRSASILLFLTWIPYMLCFLFRAIECLVEL